MRAAVASTCILLRLVITPATIFRYINFQAPHAIASTEVHRHISIIESARRHDNGATDVAVTRDLSFVLTRFVFTVTFTGIWLDIYTIIILPSTSVNK